MPKPRAQLHHAPDTRRDPAETTPCRDRWALFDSRDLADHHEARALCATCPAIDACRANLRAVLASHPLRRRQARRDLGRSAVRRGTHQTRRRTNRTQRQGVRMRIMGALTPTERLTARLEELADLRHRTDLETRRIKAALRRTNPNGRPPSPRPPCDTEKGYQRHYREGEECGACLSAHRRHERAAYAVRKLRESA